MRLSKPCLIFDGHIGRNGYGQQWDPEQKRVRGAHVLAWERANNACVLPGHDVMHACNNPPCVEEEHLSPGTRAKNLADMRAAGRACPPPRRFGEQHGRHRLTDAQVRAIRAAYTGLRGQKAALAREYGVSKTWIARLLEGRWRHADLSD